MDKFFWGSGTGTNLFVQCEGIPRWPAAETRGVGKLTDRKTELWKYQKIQILGICLAQNGICSIEIIVDITNLFQVLVGTLYTAIQCFLSIVRFTWGAN